MLNSELPRRYTDLAEWYPLITRPDEYSEEAEFYARTIIDAIGGECPTLLELGAGSGANAFHYKKYFTATLTDLSPAMSMLSRRINPDCEHVVGDMRTIRLNRTYDAVFVHDTICYMKSESDLRSVMDTAFTHLRPGGAALFAPDNTRENFSDATSQGGHDDGTRALRYLIWTSDPDPKDDTYLYEFVYLLHERGLPSQVVHEVHECGLFERNTWIALLEDVGFIASAVPFDHSEEPVGSLEVFVAKKP